MNKMFSTCKIIVSYAYLPSGLYPRVRYAYFGQEFLSSKLGNHSFTHENCGAWPLTLRLGSSKVSKHIISSFVRIHILNRLSARAESLRDIFVIPQLYIYQSTNLQYGTIVKSVKTCRAIVLNRQCSIKIEQYHINISRCFYYFTSVCRCYCNTGNILDKDVKTKL
jgi:hypothetical protein